MSETLRKSYPQEQTPRERLAFLLDQLSELDPILDKKLEPVLVPARMSDKKMKLKLEPDPARKPDHELKPRRSQARKPNRKSKPERNSFHAVLADSAKKQTVENPKTEPAESPFRLWMQLTQKLLFGGLGRISTFLRARYSKPATKRLSLSQVVSLGEKRFVAIVKVQDREFLVGGSASGLSLLAPLGKTSEPADRRNRGSGVEGRSQ
jgi:Flagellar biosynthesis protein, FliO